jgi:hypothetical protein
MVFVLSVQKSFTAIYLLKITKQNGTTTHLP